MLRDNLMEQVRDLCDLTLRLNVTRDERLEAIRRQIEQDLATVDPEDLRKDKKLRASIAQQADAIAASMAAFYALPDEEGD